MLKRLLATKTRADQWEEPTVDAHVAHAVVTLVERALDARAVGTTTRT